MATGVVSRDSERPRPSLPEEDDSDLGLQNQNLRSSDANNIHRNINFGASSETLPQFLNKNFSKHHSPYFHSV